ncbi:hypothetical protein IE53DRAFT_383648 [Violaceomyces palustris]|uniref:Uncharacterized protein n=1 Tax=Violaceomyces palustris TaxID=1673888 RepID=A0ACD0P6Y7_9BASI|nr:hypothetical protein IE53DRAFT_383648 [Violaceomyces palustris]
MPRISKQPWFQNLATRSSILICFWLAILLATPAWWRLTSITRLPLPADKLSQWLTKGACPVSFPTTARIHVPPQILARLTDPDPLSPSPLEQLATKLQASLSSSASHEHRLGQPNTQYHESCIQWQVCIHEIPLSKAFSAPLPYQPPLEFCTTTRPNQTTRDLTTSDQHEGLPESLHFNFELLPHDTPSSLLHLADDQTKVAPIHLPESSEQQPSLDHLTALILPELRRSLLRSFRSDSQGNRLDDSIVLEYARKVRILFSLMNQDASQPGAVRGWELNRAIWDQAASNGIKELLDSASVVHDFEVESQVQWFSPLEFQPTQHTFQVEEEEEYEVQLPLQAPPPPTEAVFGPQPFQAQPSVQSEPAHSKVDVDKAELADSGPAAQIPITVVDKRRRVRNETEYLIEWEDLKVFVNTAEWSLTSASRGDERGQGQEVEVEEEVVEEEEEEEAGGNVVDVHFILYIPSKDQRPMRIRDPVTGLASRTTAWLIPQWGGVVILNPEEENLEDSDSLNERADGVGEVGKVLSTQELQEPLRLFSKQLSTLLGLEEGEEVEEKMGKGEGDATTHRSPNPFRMETLTRERILETTKSTIDTLSSTLRLVAKIENLGVNQEVKGDFERSLLMLEALEDRLPSQSQRVAQVQGQGGRTDGSGQNHSESLSLLRRKLKLSSKAQSLSSSAFFNPSMLGMLYFPEEHKYAVYTPLFGPLIVPLVVASIKLFKESTVRSKKVSKKA